MAVLAIKSGWLDFSPNSAHESTCIDTNTLLIERAIIEGSGGPDNVPITEAGLRFIKHLLSLSLTHKGTNLPNFKNMDTIKNLASLFIDKYGSDGIAVQIMQDIMTGSYISVGSFSD